MAHEPAHAIVHDAGIEHPVRDGAWDEVFGEHVECGIDVLVGVAGPVHRDTFRPSGDAVIGDRLDEHDITGLLHAERRAERPHERHVDAVQPQLSQAGHAPSSPAGARTYEPSSVTVATRSPTA